MSFDFNVESRWDVGVAYEGNYESITENLKVLVKEVLGQYITVKGDSKPILAVYSGLAAGYTASAESVWGYPYSYLQPVKSHFDMENSKFIKQFTYTSAEMKALITDYDSSIVLSDDPSQWLEILSHTASMDAGRGYVTKIRVGNKVLSGYNQFQFNLMNNKFVSSCFTVTYTP
jgi:peptidoglycan hydrolase-like amidase